MQNNLRYRAWAEINLEALSDNVEKIRAGLPEQTQYMAVVKANAYGHGDEAICRHLASIGVHWFAVSNLEEAIAVREYCPDSEIFILGYTPPEFAPDLTRYNIITSVMSIDYAKKLAACAHEPVRCHLKIDTGMGRIGFTAPSPEACATQVAPLFDDPHLSLEGLFTHFAVADSVAQEDIAFTNAQEVFACATYDALAAMGHSLTHLHFMNSAATVMRPNPRATLARVGIIMYGLLPNYPEKIPLELTPVMALRSVVSYVKTVPAGTSISYGRTYVTDRERRIATVTIGYADGYARLLSNRGYALLQGKRCPIVGRVCMDQLMLDVSELSESVVAGDVVTLIGEDGDACITADELASLYGTIGYEVVCGISKRVPRIVV